MMELILAVAGMYLVVAVAGFWMRSKQRRLTGDDGALDRGGMD
jgi:hypothetical protein